MDVNKPTLGNAAPALCLTWLVWYQLRERKLARAINNL